MVLERLKVTCCSNGSSKIETSFVMRFSGNGIADVHRGHLLYRNAQEPRKSVWTEIRNLAHTKLRRVIF